MTTALIAYWTCCLSGERPDIRAQRHAHKLAAIHRHHIAALKILAAGSSTIWGFDSRGLLEFSANAHTFLPRGVTAAALSKTSTISGVAKPVSGLALFSWLTQAGTTTVNAKAHGRSNLTAAPRRGNTEQPALASSLFIPPILSDVKHVPAKPLTPALPPEMQLCSLNVSDYEIQKFLPLLTQQTGLNIILMQKSPAKVTMHVEKMKLIDVMRHVCALTGFAYIKASDAYVIAPADALKAAYPVEWLAANPLPPDTTVKVVAQAPEPPPTVKTFVANYVKAAQLVETLRKLMPANVDIVAGPGQDSPSLANVDPSEKTGQGSVSVSVEGSAGPANRTVIIRGSQANVAAALEIAKQLDIPRAQVSIAVTIHDIEDDAVKDLGLSWNFTDLTLTETPAGNGISVGKVTRSPMTFDAAIAALESKDVARLLASPNVSLLDGEKAFVLIGDRINYPVLTGYTSTNSPIFSVNTERVGVYLQVAANISSDGFITLMLYPQVSSISGYLNVNGASYPQVTSREAQTTLRVKSGDTIVLGGLLQDQDIVNVDKVPILSSLPFLGELFKHRTKTKNKSQVIITIRPIIVPAQPK